MTRAVSLHIGLNRIDPAHYAGWAGRLEGCESDANDMEALARSRGFKPRKLLTEEATADAILRAIRDTARVLERGDIFFVSFAGHGGQVADLHDEEADCADETWLAYDRQIVDDELYAYWQTFRSGVRVIVVSDSCHGGAVTSARTLDGEPPPPLATEVTAAAQSPLYRGMPRDVMIKTYTTHRDLYDGIQQAVPSVEDSDVRATVLAFLGCQDDQLARDGPRNGLYTEQLLAVWAGGGWRGGYVAFHDAIRARMPHTQQPNFRVIGPSVAAFERQTPFTVR